MALVDTHHQGNLVQLVVPSSSTSSIYGRTCYPEGHFTVGTRDMTKTSWVLLP